MNRKEAVTVQLLDREYRIACEEEERQELLQAAMHLDKEMREVRASGHILGMDKIAVMAALNITHEYLRGGGSGVDGTTAKRIGALRRKLEAALSTSVE